MVNDVISELSEEQLKEEYERLKEVCEDCMEVHRTFHIGTPCEKCSLTKLVIKLKEHFGNF